MNEKKFLASLKEGAHKLASSRKALVLVASAIIATTMCARGHCTGQEALDFIKWTVMTWFASQATVDVTTAHKGQS